MNRLGEKRAGAALDENFAFIFECFIARAIFKLSKWVYIAGESGWTLLSRPSLAGFVRVARARPHRTMR